MISPAHALLGGLRRPGDEAQLTQALAGICRADNRFASRFLTLVLETRGNPKEVPSVLEVSTEEVGTVGRFDLRFRADAWDVIVELKIHAGYGPGQLERYLEMLSNADHAYLVAITRDLPLYGEPDPLASKRWLGSVRWRELLPSLRSLPLADPDLRRQWLLFLEVLEQEGSMGFTQPDPLLFDAFAQARVATKHVEEFLRVLETPLLQALVDAVGGASGSASLYWPRGGRFSKAKWGKLDIPFRIPSGGPARVRAGIVGWTPPSAFYVQPVPNQRWDRREFLPAVRTAVDALIDRGFDRTYMRAYLPLNEERVLSDDFEAQVVSWAHDRFVDIVQSGLLDLPVNILGNVASLAEDADESEAEPRAQAT